MADIADDAARRYEFFYASYVTYRKHEGPKATGKCLCCETPLKDGRRWCDAWCRDEWRKEWRNLLPKDVPPAESEELLVVETRIVDGE